MRFRQKKKSNKLLISVILLGWFALFLTYQNFDFSNSRKSFYIPENKTTINTVHRNPGSVPDHFNYNLEMSAQNLERNLRTEVQFSDSDKLKLKLLDRTGEMSMRYQGLTDILLKYQVDSREMDLLMSQNLAPHTSLSVDHKPLKNQSHVNLGYSW